MKAHEIIKSIRYDGVKLTHLNTLSISVDQMDNTETINHADSDDFMVIILLNRLSKITVNLAHFVRCDANGVPLEDKAKRKCTQSQCIIHDACGACSCSVDYQQELNEAQKSVIFEGWEVSQNKKDDFFIYVFNKELDIEIEFDTNDGEIEILLEVSKRSFFAPEPIKSLADLAEATTENPLKLK